jgi:hypothetical protein
MADLQHWYKKYIHKCTKTSSIVIPPSGCSVFCLLCNSFHCRNFAVSNLRMSNCQDTVVNWLLLRNNFVALHVRLVLIRAINLFQKKIYGCDSRESGIVVGMALPAVIQNGDGSVI